MPELKKNVAKKQYAKGLAEIAEQRRLWDENKGEVEKFAKEIAAGKDATDEFNNKLANQNEIVRENVNELRNRGLSFEEYSRIKDEQFKENEPKPPKDWKASVKGFSSYFLSGVGNTLISAAEGWVAGLIIQGIGTGIDYIVNKDKNTVNKGKEARQMIAQKFDAYTKQKNDL